MYTLSYIGSRYISKVKATTYNGMVREVVQRCKRACIAADIFDSITHRSIGHVVYDKRQWQFIEHKQKARR
jgi:hypothetical protein